MVDCMRFFKPPISKDFVELSIGKVYFFEITNGIENRVRSKSTMAGNVINNNLYLQLMEYELIDLSRRKINSLPLRDANKLREKLKQILIKNELMTEEKKEESTEDFSTKETQWFSKAKQDIIKNAGYQDGRT